VGVHQSSVQRTGDLEGSASGDIDVLIFVVACTRLDRYEALLRQFGGWSNVVVLDRREGDRREPYDTFAGVERRRSSRSADDRLTPSTRVQLSTVIHSYPRALWTREALGRMPEGPATQVGDKRPVRNAIWLPNLVKSLSSADFPSLALNKHLQDRALAKSRGRAHVSERAPCVHLRGVLGR
jgi:hypothetical protein